MDFFVLVSRRAKFCINLFCFYQMSNAEILQSECTAYSSSKLSQIVKRFRSPPPSQQLSLCPPPSPEPPLSPIWASTHT